MWDQIAVAVFAWLLGVLSSRQQRSEVFNDIFGFISGIRSSEKRKKDTGKNERKEEDYAIDATKARYLYGDLAFISAACTILAALLLLVVVFSYGGWFHIAQRYMTAFALGVATALPVLIYQTIKKASKNG